MKNLFYLIKKRLTNAVAYYNIVFAIANAPIAQSVEHAAVNRSVIGSSPIEGAIKKYHRTVVFFYALEDSTYDTQVYSPLAVNW